MIRGTNTVSGKFKRNGSLSAMIMEVAYAHLHPCDSYRRCSRQQKLMTVQPKKAIVSRPTNLVPALNKTAA